MQSPPGKGVWAPRRITGPPYPPWSVEGPLVRDTSWKSVQGCVSRFGKMCRGRRALIPRGLGAVAHLGGPGDDGPAAGLVREARPAVPDVGAAGRFPGRWISMWGGRASVGVRQALPKPAECWTFSPPGGLALGRG